MLSVLKRSARVAQIFRTLAVAGTLLTSIFVGAANALSGPELVAEPLSSVPPHARIYLLALLATLAALLVCAGRLAGGDCRKRIAATALFLCAGGCVALGTHYCQSAQTAAQQPPFALAVLRSQVLEPGQPGGLAVVPTRGANTVAAFAVESQSAADRTRTWLAGMLDQLAARWALMPVLLGLGLASVVAILPGRRRGRDGIVPLHQACQHIDVGAEAVRLGAIIEAGLPVPKGVVLTSEFLTRWRSATDHEKRQLARRVSAAVGRAPYALRISAPGTTFAASHDVGRSRASTGISREGLSEAMDAIVATIGNGSAPPPRVTKAEPAVIVQRMVRPHLSGVLFTRAPDAPGLMLVEMVEGGADELMSGRATPLSFRFGRRTGRRIGGAMSPFDLGPLIAFGRQLESVSVRHKISNGSRTDGNSGSSAVATSPPTHPRRREQSSMSGIAR